MGADGEPSGNWTISSTNYAGGDANEFSKWVNQRLEYPQVCIENGRQGRVILSFTIKADGSLADAKVLRGVDPALDKEALRVVNSSPKWTPGKHISLTKIPGHGWILAAVTHEQSGRCHSPC